MKFKVKLAKSFAKCFQELLRLCSVLEPKHNVVSVPDDDHIALCLLAPPLIGPKIQDIVKIDVR
jgi:hypothetical protein